MTSELNWAIRFLESGRTFGDKTKILMLFVLSFVRNRSPMKIREYFDLLVKGLVLETDVKFVLGTLFDFFVMSAVWEPELKEAFDFREGMVFLDVGAHVGRYSIRAGKKLGKSGKVVAIEPSRTNYGILCKNIALNKLDNCIALNVAAYSKDCLLSLFRGDDSAKNSLKDDSGKGSYTVRARAIDNILCEFGLNHVDLIKIDVEGAEFDALRGLEQTLRSGNPKLMVEILVADKEKVKDYLSSLGYSGRLLHSSVDYKEGIMYYLFIKTKFAL